MTPLRIGFCGCGEIARQHAATFAKIPDFRMVACWNRPEEAQLAERFRADFGLTKTVADFRELAADPELDAVYICTMQNDRLRLLRAMIAAHKPVFMEKPLTLLPGELREMHRLLAHNPILFQAGYKTRFHTAMEKARTWMSKPEILAAHVLDFPWRPTSPANLPGVGGGNVLSQGVYGCEALYLLARARPVRVAALAKTLRQAPGMVDTLSASFEFANGALGSLYVADAAVPPMGISKFFVTASGGGRSLAIGSRYTRLQLCEDDPNVEQVLYTEEDGFRRQSEAFAAALRGCQPVACPFLEGAIPSIMIFEALESARGGQTRAIDVDAWLNESL